MPNRKHNQILIVDDEPEIMTFLCDSLKAHQFATTGIGNPLAALEALRTGDYDILLTDLMMPEMDGIQLLREALAIDPKLVGIVMTAQGTIQTAIEAMKVGAVDYILKPFKLQTILPVLARAIEIRSLRVENTRLKQVVAELTFKSPRLQMIGTSPAMQKVLHMIEKVAPTDATVLIRGPSGTGKELVANALHYNGSRKDELMVTINCAALQETLLESELFGHEKGSFTGAAQMKRGLFEVAEGGTLFIDEIAEMSPGMQAKMLPCLKMVTIVAWVEARNITPMCIIAATNRPLEEDIKNGKFREDLFYRLNVMTIHLPALKDRAEDIPALVHHFLSTRQLGNTPYQVDPAAMSALVRYPWPGNIRELANVIERAQILAENQTITLDDLPENMLSTPANSASCPAGPNRPIRCSWKK